MKILQDTRKCQYVDGKSTRRIIRKRSCSTGYSDFLNRSCILDGDQDPKTKILNAFIFSLFFCGFHMVPKKSQKVPPVSNFFVSKQVKWVANVQNFMLISEQDLHFLVYRKKVNNLDKLFFSMKKPVPEKRYFSSILLFFVLFFRVFPSDLKL